MNERLKQLIKDAGAIPIHGKPKDRALVGYSNIEKLVELIIRECDTITLDYRNEEYYKGWLDYRDEIKKKFGINDATH
jgi:hypothetical protein